ncbi:histidine-rich glycoprotein-like [Ischnura elegans]|uniref:histidine-rich glycoprotein-like n=1 Tax=Ischnura elegans TaxID=197161 RepID=UPI001ED892B8|nr:histidine-rich glycoprotein-like [Ischnura elegans]
MMLIPLLSVAILMASMPPINSLTVPTGDGGKGSTDGAVAHPKQSVESVSSVKVFNAPDSMSGAAVEISKSHGGPAVGYEDSHRPSQHHSTKPPQSKPEHHSSQHHAHEPSFSDALSHMSQAFRLGLCNKFGWCMPFPKDNHPASTSPIDFPSTAHFETEYDKDAFLGMGSSSSHGKNPFGMISSVFHGWHDDHDSSSVHGSKPQGSHRIPHQINKPGHHHDGEKHQIGDDHRGSHGHHQSAHKPDHGTHDHHQSHTDTHHKPHEPHGGPLKPTPIHEEHHHGESHHSPQGAHHGHDSPGSGLYFTDTDHSSNPHSDHHPETSMHGSAHGATHHGELSFGNHHHGTPGHHEKPHGDGSHTSGQHHGSNYPHHHLSGSSHGVHPQSSNTGHHTHQPESSVHGHHAGGHHSSSPHKDEHHVSAANSHYKPHFNAHLGGDHAAVKPNKHHPYMTITYKPLFGPLRLPWSVKKFLLV